MTQTAKGLEKVFTVKVQQQVDTQVEMAEKRRRKPIAANFRQIVVRQVDMFELSEAGKVEVDSEAIFQIVVAQRQPTQLIPEFVVQKFGQGLQSPRLGLTNLEGNQGLRSVQTRSLQIVQLL